MNSNFFILIVVAALLVLTPPAAAQSADQVVVQNETTQEPPAHQRMDNNTQLVDARLEDGTAVLVLKSDITQRVTVTDVGSFMREGEPMTRRDYVLKRGEKTTIRMDLYTKGGYAGVTIDTGEVLWPVPLDDPYNFLPGGPTTTDVQLAAVTGLSLTGVLGIGIAIKRRRGLGDEVERLV